MATFLQIKTEIQDTLARTDATVTGKIGGWVNRRQRLAANRHNFLFLRNQDSRATVVDTQEYTLPANFKDDIQFFIQKTTEYVPLEIRSLVEMLRLYSPDTKGEPRYITFEFTEKDFRVWPPKPDAVYTINIVYYRWPPDLSDNGDTNWFTDNADVMLVAGAVADGLWFLGAEQDAGPWEQRYEAEFQRVKTYDQERQLPQFGVLVPRWDVKSPAISARRDAGWPWP